MAGVGERAGKGRGKGPPRRTEGPYAGEGLRGCAARACEDYSNSQVER